MRRAAVAVAALAIVVAVAVAGWAFAAGERWPDGVSVTATRYPATSTSVEASTTTPKPTPPTTTDASGSPAAQAAELDTTPPTDAGSEPTTTTTPPESSPWPPGTVVGYLGDLTTGTIEFSPSSAPSGASLAFTATLTNPSDHWVFGSVDYRGLALYLHTPNTEYDIPHITKGVWGTAPEFQHQTPQGLQQGLLLAPHASYSFSNDCGNEIEYYATADYVVQADIIYAPVGVANGTGTIVADAGSFTVTIPPAGSTTTNG
jgi:hypothetical protein